MYTNPATPNVTNQVNQLQRFGFTGRFHSTEKPQEESKTQGLPQNDVVELSESAKEKLARMQGKSDDQLAADEALAIEQALSSDDNASTVADDDTAVEEKQRGRRFEKLLEKQPPGLMKKLRAYGLRAQLPEGSLQPPAADDASQPINGEAPIAAEDEEPLTAADIPPGTQHDEDEAASELDFFESTAVHSYEAFAGTVANTALTNDDSAFANASVSVRAAA